MFLVKTVKQILNRHSICSVEHHSVSLRIGAEGVPDIRRRTLYANLLGINRDIIEAPHLNFLFISIKNAGRSHIPRSIQLLYCSNQNGQLCFDNGISFFEFSPCSNLIAGDGQLFNIGDLRNIELFCNLRPNLCGIAVNSLPAAEDYIKIIYLLNCGCNNIGGCPSIRASKRSVRKQYRLIMRSTGYSLEYP